VVVVVEPVEPQCQPSARRAEEQRGLNALQVLIDNARLAKGRGRRRLSYREMSERSGLDIPVSTLRHLCADEMRNPPKREHLEGVAKALDLELAELQRVAGAVFGWNVYGARDAKVELLVASVAQLSDRDLEAVRALVDALRRPAADGPEAGTA
jgi:transcriptional regulator with XRE-family HTH domain